MPPDTRHVPETEALIYTVIASVVAYAVNCLFVGWAPVFLLPQSIQFTRLIELVGDVLLGVVAGVIGAIESPFFMKFAMASRAPDPKPRKPAIGGLLMGLIALVVPETISTGYGWLQTAMTGGYGLIVRSMLATTIAFVVERIVSVVSNTLASLKNWPRQPHRRRECVARRP